MFYNKTVFRLLLEKEMKKAAKEIGLRKSVLDIGSKNAPYKKLFKTEKYTAIDLEKHENVDFQMDAQNLKFKNSSFDLVIATNVLYCVENVDKVISEAKRVLVPNGTFLASAVFLYPFIYLDNDLNRFTPLKVKKAFKNFREVKIIAFGGIIAVITNLIIKWIQYQKKPLRMILFPLKLLMFGLGFLSFYNEKFALGYFIIAKK
ncbi:MAG: class I SAM-dependent methyltransferase [archaeon]